MTKRRRPGDDYEVGYGRPPKNTRFQPGRSGNPNGRPRKLETVDAVLDKTLSRRLRIEEDGRVRRISAQEVVIRQLTNKAAKGDARAIKLLFDLRDRYRGSPAERLDPLDLQTDQEILDAYLTRLNAGEPAPKPEVEGDRAEKADEAEAPKDGDITPDEGGEA